MKNEDGEMERVGVEDKNECSPRGTSKHFVYCQVELLAIYPNALTLIGQ